MESYSDVVFYIYIYIWRKFFLGYETGGLVSYAMKPPMKPPMKPLMELGSETAHETTYETARLEEATMLQYRN